MGRPGRPGRPLEQRAFELRPERWGNRNTRIWEKRGQREPPVKNQGMPLTYQSKKGARGIKSVGWRAGWASDSLKGFSRVEDWPGQATSLLCKLGTSPCLCPQQGVLVPNSMCPWGTLALWAVLPVVQLERYNRDPHLGSSFSPSPNFYEAGVQRQRMWLLLLKGDNAREAQGHRPSLPAQTLPSQHRLVQVLASALLRAIT